MIKHMFVFGVVIPTIITVLFFVGFLICWFKFNIHKRLFTKRKPNKKDAFAAHEINSTQKIVQYGQDEEEYDNEKNSEFDKHNGDDDEPKGAGKLGVNSVPPRDTTSKTKGKYIITPSQIEYHYQENLKFTQTDETIEPHLTTDSSVECSLCPTNKEAGGVTNDGLCVSPSMELETQELKHSELLVQHTFHFPNLAHCEANPKACQMEECHYYGETDEESDNDNENYGHFVPVSEVIQQNEKRKQFYKAYGCGEGETNNEKMANLTEHLAPLQEV